jgi:arginine-tRNA-protein transferase
MSSESREQEFLLYRSQGERCPYLPNREWVTHWFAARRLHPAFYEQLISQGFRRSGIMFYQNHCPGCTACLPIRVDVRRFRASKSQRRVLRKNRNVRITRHPVTFEVADFLLYRNYCEARHSSSPDPEGYAHFLVISPVPTEIMRYYVDDRLVGLGWIDILPHSLSSVYFSFNPSFASRSPGTFSILRQIELCRELGKDWLQLGFWVQACQNMAYKSHFKPCQILVDGVWQNVEDS